MLINLHPQPADMARLVSLGMAKQPKQLPAWLLYDAEGSRLFDAICEQPEYGLTRTEMGLLEQHADAMAAALGPGVLVEFGAGSARKVGPLLTALRPPAYVPLDISAEHLEKACGELQRRFPKVPVLGICCDYSQLDHLPAHPLLTDQNQLGFYPGSSLGNFSRTEAQALLCQLRRLLGPGGKLLIGIDQPKEVARLEAAYNDRAGVSAAFAKNLLVRLNRDLAGSFDPDLFRYRARWEADQGRIAMALVSEKAQTVELAGQSWGFTAGEELISEYSLKYSREAFTALAAAAGWGCSQSWTDPQEDFSLHLLVRADSVEAPQG